MDLDGFEKLSSNSLLDFNNKSVEETIIEISKWALLAIRIPGYLPLTKIRSNLGLQLELVRCSPVTFYTIFITAFVLIGNGFFAHTFLDKFFLNKSSNPTDYYGNTEGFVWVSLLILVCYTTYLRMIRIIYCKHNLNYWKKTIELIESFVSLDYHLNSSKLLDLSKSCRNWTIFYILIGIGRMSYGSYNLHYNLVSYEIIPEGIKALYLDLFLALTLCFHVGYAIWLTYLIKLLIFCFDTIHEDLGNLHCVRATQFKTNDVPNLSRSGTVIRRTSNVWQLDTNVLLKDDHISSRNTTSQLANDKGFADLENRIRKTLQGYESIEEQMHGFNKLFGTSLIFETAFAFVLLIVNVYAGQSYWGYDLETLFYVFFTMGVPIAIYSTSLFHFATECSILSGKATTILKKLEQFFVTSDKPQLQMVQFKLIAFIARVADNPPNISASHFFSVNRYLLTSILGTVTTYLIVLLQFKQAGIPTPSAISNQTSLTTGVCNENMTWTCQCSSIILMG